MPICLRTNKYLRLYAYEPNHELDNNSADTPAIIIDPLLLYLQLINPRCFISRRLTLAALPAANRPLTALPAVTTVYKVELCSLEYGPSLAPYCYNPDKLPRRYACGTMP